MLVIFLSLVTQEMGANNGLQRKLLFTEQFLAMTLHK